MLFWTLLDIAQVFDRIWHEGLLYKLKLFMPTPYYLNPKSYLQNRSFIIPQGHRQRSIVYPSNICRSSTRSTYFLISIIFVWSISLNLLTPFLLHMPTTPLFLPLVQILKKLQKYFRIMQIKLIHGLNNEELK